MSVTYECPGCGAKLKSANPVPEGKSIRCPRCGTNFRPETVTAPEPAGTLKFADDEPPPPRPAPPASPPARPSSQPAPAAKASPFADDEDDPESIRKGYNVVLESAEEKEKAEKNKPDFLAVLDRYKRSARGPAMALLVLPSKLLIAEGLLTVAAAIAVFIMGMWPLVFNDAPPGEEELEEAIMQMALGVVIFFWGAMVCFGASQMQELASYPWAMVGAVMGVLPLLVGIYAIVMLQNPKVKAGFEEGEGGPDDDEDQDDT